MNNQAVEILKNYTKCRYPNVAMEYYFSDLHVEDFACITNVTADKFRRVLDGTATLSLDEMASLERMLDAMCGHKRGIDYLASPVLSVYDVTNNPKHWRKVKWIYEEYSIALKLSKTVNKPIKKPCCKDRLFPCYDLFKLGVFPRAGINAILDYLLKMRKFPIPGTEVKYIYVPIKKGDILEEYPDIKQAVKERVAHSPTNEP